ncbi:MAG: hypothetical protein WAU47_09770, partial [Desulfobaccales bacterium]
SRVGPFGDDPQRSWPCGSPLWSIYLKWPAKAMSNSSSLIGAKSGNKKPFPQKNAGTAREGFPKIPI